MYQFPISKAQEAVRKNLDELDPNGSVMYDDESGEDNLSLDNLIARFLPEAINEVNKVAPVTLLEGTEVKSNTSVAYDSPSEEDNHVVKITINAALNYLRLVAFKAEDSNIVITDAIEEASPEGRKQHNKYIRGTYDRPRLVIQQASKDGSPIFKYYSYKNSTPNPASTNVTTLSIIQEVRFEDTSAGYIAPSGNNSGTYDSCLMLRQNYIDYITARVMETFGDARAQAYYTRALTFPTA